MPDAATPASLAASLAGIYVAYAVVKSKIHPSPVERARAYEAVHDALVGIAMFSIFYFTYMNLAPLVKSIGAVVGVEVSSSDIGAAVRDASRYFEELTSAIKGLLRALYYGIIVLNVVPVTAPLGIYAFHATWYLQYMASWALVNATLLTYMSEVAANAMLLVGLGCGLMPIRQLRFVASILVSLGLVTPASLVIVAEASRDIIGPGIYDFGNVLSAIPATIREVVTGGFELGQSLQTFNIVVDLSLAITAAVVYGVSRAIDEVGHAIMLR